jgi:hypothetical protein
VSAGRLHHFDQKDSPFAIGQHQGLQVIGFEERFPIGLPNAESPHLDVFAIGSGGVIGIESKCAEYLAAKPADFSERYKSIAERRDEDPWFNEMLRLKSSSDANINS